MQSSIEPSSERWRRELPKGSSLAGLLLLLAACSSSPPLPATEYFPAVESELERLDQATRDLTDRYAVELEAEVEALVADSDSSAAGAADRLRDEVIAIAASKMQAIIESHAEQVDVFITRVEKLTPPKAVSSKHAELADAFRSWAGSGEETVTQLGTAGDLNGLVLALQQSPYADGQLRVDQACRALLDDAAVVDVVLTCPGTELQPLQVGS
jgi:hypothetical protein